MTQYPPQQPGPQGPWDPSPQAGPQGAWNPDAQPQTFEYPEYPGYGAPPAYGYGAPPQGYPGYSYPYPHPPQQPPKKNNALWWIVGGAVSVMVIAALVVGGVFLVRGGDIIVSSDETEIKELVEEFSAAGSTGKFSEMGRYFCAAEAGMFSALGELGQILEGIEIPQTAPTTGLSATDIVVKGDVASATMETGGPFETAYFRKENGEWKVCMSAAVQFNQR